MSERFLEKIGILKHQLTLEELDAAELKRRELTESYMTGTIPLEEYTIELDKLPGIDSRKLAHDLNYKG